MRYAENGCVMVTEFDSNTFEHDYIIAILGHLVQDLKTEKPVSQLIDHYAVELTGFMNGMIHNSEAAFMALEEKGKWDRAEILDLRKRVDALERARP